MLKTQMAKKSIKYNLMLIFLFLKLVGFVVAYIDPGTGGIIINSINSFIAGILGGILAFLIYIFKIIKKRLKNNEKKKK